jgi:hypothetical protein
MSTQLLALTLSAKTANTLRKDYADRLATLSLDLVQTSNRAKGTLTGAADSFSKLIRGMNRDIHNAMNRRALRLVDTLTLVADEIGQGLPCDEDEPETSVCKMVTPTASTASTASTEPTETTETPSTETTETETPSNEVLDSLFMVDHGDIRTGADILEDADTTLHALQVALNEGVCDEQNTALVTLVRRVTFCAEETRKEALASRDALAILKNEHPAVYALINQNMREEYGYLWTRRLDLAHESLLIGMWEDLGYAPPKGYTWTETFEAIDDAWDAAHGN